MRIKKEYGLDCGLRDDSASVVLAEMVGVCSRLRADVDSCECQVLNIKALVRERCAEEKAEAERAFKDKVSSILKEFNAVESSLLAKPGGKRRKGNWAT